MLTLRAISGASGYGKRHLEANDYWSEQEKVTGRWWGKAAAKLGLAGAVLADDLEALGNGFNPLTGVKLRQRFSTAKVQKDGSVSKPIQFQDAVFSAPKSVSILACLGDSRLLAAHDKAVMEALAVAESLATTRVRASGASADRQTTNLAAAIYRHDSSRALDCNVHSHCVLSNVTWDEVEQKWKALKAATIYNASQFLTEVYRNELAKQCGLLGYKITPHNGSFEIAGVSPSLLEKFSQRSKERDAAIADFVRKHKRQPSKDEIAVLVRETRAAKLVEISSAEVRAQQRARLTPAEAQLIENLVNQAQSGGSSSKAGSAASAKDCLDFAIAHLFERLSVVRDFEILKEALKQGRGALELRELQAVFERMVKGGELLRQGNEVTTKACLSRERAMIALVNSGMGRHGRLGGKLACFEPGAKLNEQQRAAIAQVLDCRDEFLSISGAAGVGKTLTLSVLHQALKKAGQQVVALAPSMAAVQELQAVGFRDAMTLQRLLLDSNAQAALAGKVVILDEAGMVSAQDMANFLSLARAAGARGLLVGDVKQISSVNEGDALRVLQKYSFMRTVSINKVERQRGIYREAMEVFRENSARGLSKLEAMGAVLEVLPENRAVIVGLAYESESKKLNSKGQKQSVLVVAATHHEIDLITSQIRAGKMERRELGDGQEFDHLKALHWTEAQRGNAESFRPGQFLVFHRETKQTAKDSAWQVVQAQVVKGKNEVLARGADGQEIWLKVNQLKKAFGVFERQKIEVRAGDKLLLQANWNKDGLHVTNGELVDVATVTSQGIQLADGRVLPGDYQQFNYGVCVTANKAQGQTVDSVIVSAEGMRNKKQAYVALSRGRERVKLICSNQEAFLDAIEDTGERKSAVELMGNESIRAHRARRVLDAILSRGQQLMLDTKTRLSSVLGKDGARKSANQGQLRGKN